MMRYTILAVLSALFFLVSCTEGKDMFDVPHAKYTLFKADFENVDLAGEKSAFIWKKENGIGVFGSESGVNEKYVLKKAYDGKAEGEFYGPLVTGDTIKAYYPYSEKFALHDGAMAYSLSASQAYRLGSTLIEQFSNYAGYAYAFKENENELMFRYASGLLTVKMDFPEAVTLERMTLKGAENNLAGMGKVSPDMSISFAAGGLNSIEVVFDEDALSQKNDTKTAYPIVLPAGKYHDLTLVMESKERNNIMVRLDSLEILKVTSGEFMVTEVTVGMNPLGEYEVVGELEFDYVTTRDNTDVLNKFEIVGDLELELE